MSVLPILTGADNPVLRKKTKPVTKVTKSTLALFKDMEATLKHVQGLGLAAPQVGKSLRLCIAKIHENTTPLINPAITWKSKEMATLEEGCLSLPGLFVPVPRAMEITVQYLDTSGRQQERRLQGLDARVVQHEVDHLDGVLIIDYEAQRTS